MSYFSICHGASFPSKTRKKVSYSKKKNSKYKQVSIKMKKISHSKYKIGVCSWDLDSKFLKSSEGVHSTKAIN